jgi:hypothetical protein
MSRIIALRNRPERLFSLRELEVAGYSSRDTLHKLIASDAIPAVKVGNAWKIRERDLPRLAEDIGAAPSKDVELVDLEDIAAVAAQVVTTWPRLTDESKAELGRLLAGS